MVNKKRIFQTYLLLLSLILTTVLALWILGYRINMTPSLPTGIYKLTPLNAKISLKKDDLIAFCPPLSEPFLKNNLDFVSKNGICPDGYRPLFKKIVALNQDIVRVSDRVYVNNQPVPKSQPQISLSNKKRLYPCYGIRKIGKNQLFVMGENEAKSFDSRYFCAIDKANVLGLVKKI